MSMEQQSIFASDKRYDEPLHVFVHSGVTYCFFILSENPLPDEFLEETIKPHQIFAAAICYHITTYGKVSCAREIIMDAQCMSHSKCKGLQVVKVCEHLCHIFIAI